MISMSLLEIVMHESYKSIEVKNKDVISLYLLCYVTLNMIYLVSDSFKRAAIVFRLCY